jgi:hypothetical protein
MLVTIILTLAIVGLSFLLLGVKMLLVRGGKFPDSHVDKNEFLHKKGITCAKFQDKQIRRQRSLYELINKENI